eukprot:gene13186-biopygen7997
MAKIMDDGGCERIIGWTLLGERRMLLCGSRAGKLSPPPPPTEAIQAPLPWPRCWHPPPEAKQTPPPLTHCRHLPPGCNSGYHLVSVTLWKGRAPRCRQVPPICERDPP